MTTVVDSLRKIDTKGRAEVYVIDKFLSDEECDYLVAKIDEKNRKSTVVSEDGIGYHQGRTSSTADLNLDDEVLKGINERMAAALPEFVLAQYGETPQGQKYQPGEFFNDHHDFFADKEIKAGTCGLPDSGQRNWTFMINLNTVEVGGETDFPKLGIKFQPKKGQAVVWRNINSNGHGNDFTLHAGRPPVSGNKYIITKWFRTGPQDMYQPLKVKEAKKIVSPYLEPRVFSTKEELPIFHPLGFELKDLPESIWGYIQDIYNLVQHTEEDEPMKGFIKSEMHEFGSSIMNMDRIPNLKRRLHKMLLPMHTEWIGGKYELEPATCYGIRSYKRGSTLTQHYDRVSELHVSGIILVDQKVEEPWGLDIQDHSGQWHNITMNPGQIILYESSTCMHGRNNPLQGDYYRNFFIHYKLKDWTYKG